MLSLGVCSRARGKELRLGFTHSRPFPHTLGGRPKTPAQKRRSARYPPLPPSSALAKFAQHATVHRTGSAHTTRKTDLTEIRLNKLRRWQFPSHRPRLVAQYSPCSSPLYGLQPPTPIHVFLTRTACVGSVTPTPVLSRAPHCWRQSPFAGLMGSCIASDRRNTQSLRSQITCKCGLHYTTSGCIYTCSMT